jgi:hypothetical protein
MPLVDKDTENAQTEPLVDPVMVRTGGSLGRDTKAFLLNYPHETDDLTINSNTSFYSNDLKFRPYGLFVDDFLTKAHGKFRLLELHHGYIQWLFPIREQGLNSHADPLQPHEAHTIRTTPKMQQRLLQSLYLMLDFYGMAVDPQNPLIVTRHPDPEINKSQYNNLTRSYHNYLRLTRIFKALVELGQQDYVPSVLLFILSEQSEYALLNSRELKASMDRYWVYCMREREAQATVATAIKWVRDDRGSFTGQMYRRIINGKETGGVWEFHPPEGVKKDVIIKKEVNGTGIWKIMKRYSMRQRE